MPIPTVAPRRTHLSTAGALTAILLVLGLGSPAVADDAERDPAAIAVAERVLEELGGQAAWDATRTIRFDFAGFRTHYWDRHTGDHRLEGKTRDGDTYLVLHNVNDEGKGAGSAWKNGEASEGEERAKFLEMAYGAWINDTYWLLMPYKLLDPGVNLASEGTEELDGTTHHKLRMTFQGVGQTPGDTYWVWVDANSQRVTRWAYVLESFEEGQEATAWTWEGWERHGSILLPTNHRQVGGDRALPTDNLGVFGDVSTEVFSGPEEVDPSSLLTKTATMPTDPEQLRAYAYG